MVRCEPGEAPQVVGYLSDGSYSVKGYDELFFTQNAAFILPKQSDESLRIDPAVRLSNGEFRQFGVAVTDCGKTKVDPRDPAFRYEFYVHFLSIISFLWSEEDQLLFALASLDRCWVSNRFAEDFEQGLRMPAESHGVILVFHMAKAKEALEASLAEEPSSWPSLEADYLIALPREPYALRHSFGWDSGGQRLTVGENGWDFNPRQPFPWIANEAVTSALLDYSAEPFDSGDGFALASNRHPMI